MASTYTTSLKIQQIGNGEQSGVWGTTTNTNWSLIEQAVAGVTNITMLNANYTLSNLNGVSDEARNMVLVVAGTNSGIRQIIAPLVTKFYVVTNNTVGGYAITIGGASGSLITVPSNTTVQVYCDGINFYSAQTSSAGNFNVNGDLSVNGNETVGGNLSVTGTTTANLASTSTAVTQTAGDSSTKVATTAFVAQNAVFTGALLMWPTASAPSGYLLCNGTAVSRTTYAALFAIVGTTFGAGDGSTTFNLPNYADRMPIGVGTIAASVGTTGGSKDAIVVSHNHTASSSTTATDSGHTHSMAGSTSTSGPTAGNFRVGSFTDSSQQTNSASANITASTTTTVNSTGSSGTNANLPPYMGINFIIKT